MVYATASDLEAGWRPLDPDEESRAGTLLERASLMLDSHGPFGADKGPALKAVCCAMVQRVMSRQNLGVVQESQTGGSYSHQWTYANPTADMYITKAERRMLGIGGHAGGMVKLDIHDRSGESVDW